MAKMMVARARASSDPSVVEASLRDADALLAGAIGDTRTLINTVSPPSLYDLGLEAALSTLVDGHREGSSARFDYIDDGSAKPIVPARRAVVYRIARELLLNAVKHSEASEIVVATSRSGNMLVVEVVDDGVGFDVETSGHSSYGLPSLRERVAGLGGRLQVDSSPGRGTVVRFRVPLDQGANQVHG
jgi:two-component system sensor histidine kinase DegS